MIWAIRLLATPEKKRLIDIVREAKIQFNHNFRSYEIVAKLEKKYPHFDGLNLTREVLVGILKHQTVFDMPGADIPKQYRDEGPTLEAQIVDIADSLAYLNHDVDDGLTSGCIVEEDLMDSRPLAEGGWKDRPPAGMRKTGICSDIRWSKN